MIAKSLCEIHIRKVHRKFQFEFCCKMKFRFISWEKFLKCKNRCFKNLKPYKSAIYILDKSGQMKLVNRRDLIIISYSIFKMNVEKFARNFDDDALQNDFNYLKLLINKISKLSVLSISLNFQNTFGRSVI